MYLVSYFWVPTVVFVEGMIEGVLWDYQVNGSIIGVFPKIKVSKLCLPTLILKSLTLIIFVEQNHTSTF